MFIILFKKKILNISNIYRVGVQLQSKYRYSSQLRSAATEVDVDPAVPGLAICHVPVLPHLSTKEALAVQILSSSRIFLPHDQFLYATLESKSSRIVGLTTEKEKVCKYIENHLGTDTYLPLSLPYNPMGGMYYLDFLHINFPRLTSSLL